MATIKTREYLFRPKPRRGRHALGVALLAGASLAAAVAADGGNLLQARAQADAPVVIAADADRAARLAP